MLDKSKLYLTANMCVENTYHEKLYFWNTTKSCIFEILQKVVLFEISLHWFKCMNYSLYDMIFFPKIQLEMQVIRCTWDSN